MLLRSGQPGAYVVHHHPELTVAERTRTIGQARLISSGTVVAGELISLAFDLTIGERDMPTGSRLAIAWTWPLDFGDLQITDPEASNHLATAVDRCGAHSVRRRAYRDKRRAN